MMTDYKWRIKIHRQILAKIDKEYKKLLKTKNSLEFTDSLFRFMLIEFCLLKHNTSPMDTPNPAHTCMNTAFGMDTFPEHMMFVFEGPPATSSLPVLNFKGNRTMTYSYFLFLPSLTPESRTALLEKVLHLCPRNSGYDTFVSNLHELAPIYAPFLIAALKKDQTMKDQKRSVVADLPEHAHMVNSKQLLPLSLEEDVNSFIQDLGHDLDIDTNNNTSQIMEKRIRAILNDSEPKLTIQAKIRILQNLINQPSSL